MDRKCLSADDVRDAIDHVSVPYYVYDSVKKMSYREFRQANLQKDLGISYMELRCMAVYLEKKHDVHLSEQSIRRIVDQGNSVEALLRECNGL